MSKDASSKVKHYGRKQAIARLRKMLGPTFAFRESPNIAIGEERLHEVAHREELKKQIRERELAIRARRSAVLAADAEYQALMAALTLDREWEQIKEQDRAIRARRSAVLADDAEYQASLAAQKADREVADKLCGPFDYRIVVGVMMNVAGMSYFERRAEGNTWSEAVAVAERAIARRAD